MLIRHEHVDDDVDQMTQMSSSSFLVTWKEYTLPLCQKTSNHHANLPLEMYSFTLYPPGKHLETTGADDLTLWLSPCSLALGQ